MALETLKGVEKIDGFDVVVMDDLREKYPERFTETGAMDAKWFESDIRPNKFIYVRNDKNSLSFTIQNGPVREVGVNGCQVDTVIAAGHAMLKGLNEKFPCHENEMAIMKISEALAFLTERKRSREARGVEGTSQA